jgi:hypothetical protein
LLQEWESDLALDLGQEQVELGTVRLQVHKAMETVGWLKTTTNA